LKEKKQCTVESLDFGFVHLDNLGLSQLADKKRQETKQTYCVDKQKINTTEINDDCIMTERPAANTQGFVWSARPNTEAHVALQPSHNRWMALVEESDGNFFW